MAFIAARSGGHPLFAEQLAFALRDAGRLAPGADLAAIEVPESVEGLIANRLDGLPAHVRTVAKVASVVGGPVDRTLLAELDVARARRRGRRPRAARRRRADHRRARATRSATRSSATSCTAACSLRSGRTCTARSRSTTSATGPPSTPSWRATGSTPASPRARWATSRWPARPRCAPAPSPSARASSSAR